MDLAEELRAVAAQRGPAAAVAMVKERAAAGGMDALEMIGQWQLWGIYAPRDVVAGYRAIAAAAAAGSVQAGFTQAALLCTGTGVQANEAAAIALVRALTATSELARQQIALVEADAQPEAAQVICASPYAARIDGLLSPAECRYLIAHVGARVRPSLVIDPRSGRRIANPIRDSHGANVTVIEEDVAIHAINRRIAAATATEWSQGEPLHLLRYEAGQQYRPHLDALPGVSNQRVLTVLLYLSDDYDGGQTRFRDGLTFRGATGDALIFANVEQGGRPDPRSEHAGLPVRQGVKWLATRWIRAKPFDPWANEVVS